MTWQFLAHSLSLFVWWMNITLKLLETWNLRSITPRSEREVSSVSVIWETIETFGTRSAAQWLRCCWIKIINSHPSTVIEASRERIKRPRQMELQFDWVSTKCSASNHNWRERIFPGGERIKNIVGHAGGDRRFFCRAPRRRRKKNLHHNEKEVKATAIWIRLFVNRNSVDNFSMRPTVGWERHPHRIDDDDEMLNMCDNHWV